MTKRINYIVHGNSTHGQSSIKKGRTAAYLSWMNMKGRCLNINNPKYSASQAISTIRLVKNSHVKTT